MTRKRLSHFVRFSAVGVVGSKFLGLIGFVILARLLSPHEFGLMAMVAIFTAFASIFIDSGFQSALVQMELPEERHYSSVFWFNLLCSISLYLVLYISSANIAAFFMQDELENILQVAGLVLIINSLTIVNISILLRKQEFKKIAILDIIPLTFGLMTVIILVYQGFGVWALVAQLLVTSSTSVLIAFYTTQWRPKLLFDFSSLNQLWSFSSYLLGTGIINFIISNADSVIIGRMLNATTLGLYKYAYQLASMPGQLIGTTVERVFFSEYSLYKNDKERIKKIHFRAVRMIAMITFPSMLILSSVSEYFVLGVLGVKWIEMAPILSFLCFILVLDSIGGMNNPLFLSQGKTKELFKVTVIFRLLFVIGMIIGIQYGVFGLLWGMMIVRVVNFVPIYKQVGKTIGFTVKEFIRNIMPIALMSLITYVIMMIAVHYYSFNTTAIISLMILSVFGGITFIAGLFIFQKEIIHDFLHVMKVRSKS